MATLIQSLEKILQGGPGHRKGQLRVLSQKETLFEVAIPHEEGFRPQGVYLRFVANEDGWSVAQWDAGKTHFPKTAFNEKGFVSPFCSMTNAEIEHRVQTILAGT